MHDMSPIVIQEKAPEKGWKLKDGLHSFSKLWVKMPDGTTYKHWSLDWRGSHSGLRTQVLGIARLELLLAKNYPGHAVAIIYDKASNAKLLVSEAGIITHREFR